MKGISHFISGIAAASFFPWTVDAAIQGNPLYFIIGGAFALLPDTLDFKVYRYFYRHDACVDPDPRNPNPRSMAEALAEAVGRAHRERKPIRVKLNTLQLGADCWQQYKVRFDAERQVVAIRLGPAVDTGQTPLPGTEPADAAPASVPLPCPVVQTYEALTTVDIFDGPTFRLEPDGEGRVVIHFLPWHRQGSHSLVTGLAMGLAGTALWGWRAGVVLSAGFAAHVLEDQLGFMGSALFWPFSRRRYRGLQRMHAVDAGPNFLTVWTCCLLLFWNLYRHLPDPLYPLHFLQLLFFGGVLPLGLYALLARLLRRKSASDDATDIPLAEEWGEEA